MLQMRKLTFSGTILLWQSHQAIQRLRYSYTKAVIKYWNKLSLISSEYLVMTEQLSSWQAGQPRAMHLLQHKTATQDKDNALTVI